MISNYLNIWRHPVLLSHLTHTREVQPDNMRVYNYLVHLASHAHARSATLTFICDDSRASQNVKHKSLRVAHKSILCRYVLPLPPD